MQLWRDDFKKKLIVPNLLPKVVLDLRKSGKSIATLNGSFDLLHAGHLQIIYEASQLADQLILALNSDNSIKTYKSKNRPIIPLDYRLQMVAALEFVDYVTWFDETDPIALLNIIKPDIHINGAEYGAECLEADTVIKNGGKIHICQKIDGLSTTDIIQGITSCA
ncbi:MAG: adenylyltransferase/cytidyltransferase family protein [Waddliaceae bacterium]